MTTTEKCESTGFQGTDPVVQANVVKDCLLIGATNTPSALGLLAWYDGLRRQNAIHEFMPDYHRLVLERWIWDQRALLQGKRVMDVSAEAPRRWLGEGYFTFGHGVGLDVGGDLLDWPFGGDENPITNLDAIICTEVLEHCRDPFTAVEHMRRSLKVGGLLLVTSPFLWAWHGTPDYPDYWRFSHQAWELLLDKFDWSQVDDVPWTDEGEQLIDLVRRFEGWGFRDTTEARTAYLCRAVK